MPRVHKMPGDGPAQKQQMTPVKIAKLVISILLIAIAVFFTIKAVISTNDVPDEFFLRSDTAKFMIVDMIEDDAFEEAKVVEVNYMTPEFENCTATVAFTEEDAEGGVPTSFTGWVYSNISADDLDGHAYYYGFDHEPTGKELKDAVRSANAVENTDNFGAGMAILFVAIAVVLMFFWHDFFTRYEQIWFIAIITLAAIISVIWPEEEINGINGLVIMLLYLLDTFLNILCELLISKQSKWNFIVSVFVELTEIAICIVLSYRFATLASTLFFWLPCDIISFVNWHKHPDKVEDELTEVRSLKGWQEIAIVAGIVVWTVVVGWFLSGLDITTDLFGGNKVLETVVCYVDACASAVGVVNGLFILFRLREQWIAWYISAALETALNIMAGQWMLLPLKLGYFTNTTYGYIKWTKYIKGAGKDGAEKAKNAHEKVRNGKKA